MLESLKEGVLRLTALGAVCGALDILLEDGPPKRGVKLLSGLYAVLEMARLAAKLLKW